MNTITKTASAAADPARAAQLMTSAFAADPVARWAFPDDANYRATFPAFVRAFAGRAFDCGTDVCHDGMEAAALWLPPTVEPDDEAVAAAVAAIRPFGRRDEVLSFMDGMARIHPTEPHWYLPMMGVEPARQGCGLGSELMRRGVERCDRTGLPAYLEATTERSRALYARFGFAVITTIQACSSPPMFAMWREPRPATD